MQFKHYSTIFELCKRSDFEFNILSKEYDTIQTVFDNN
jgi:hypothetical protein